MPKTRSRKYKKQRKTRTRKSKPDYLAYVNPHVYQKRGDFGMGTYTSKSIPSGTVIIEEFPHNINAVSDDDYKYKLIRHLLNTDRKNFMDLVPLELDYDANDIYDYEKHMKFFPELSDDMMKLYYMKYKSNAFSFDNHPSILFFSTKMNHSCDSNCMYYRDNDRMVFKAKRDIQAGEELFDSYISCDVPREERQKTLKQRYGFHCACSRCNKEKYETSY